MDAGQGGQRRFCGGSALRGAGRGAASTDSGPCSLVSEGALPLRGCTLVAVLDADVSLPQCPFCHVLLSRQAPVKGT